MFDCKNFCENTGEAESFEHQPFHGKISQIAADLAGEYVEYEDGRQPHRKGRKHTCNQDAIDIRRLRLNTNRQMDNIWLMKIIMSTLSWSNYETLDEAAHLVGVNDELNMAADYEHILNDQHWRHHHNGPMTEAMQNCHGWGDKDPAEEKDDNLCDIIWDDYQKTVGWGDGNLMKEDGFSKSTEVDENMFDDFEHLPVGNATGRRMQSAVRNT
ncbi:hypothetical protein KC723_00455 [Candidatus Kaiserbacteria bacterium]|nr:hypothetical protein [Candidatus Kaiserbacteria bacterium]